MLNQRIWKNLEVLVPNCELIRHSKHIACITMGSRILSYGSAKYKSHPLMAKFQDKPERIYLHAEIDAIISCINKYGTEILKEADLYVLRTTKSGVIGNSKPCVCCERAIKAFELKNVYWSEECSTTEKELENA